MMRYMRSIMELMLRVVLCNFSNCVSKLLFKCFNFSFNGIEIKPWLLLKFRLFLCLQLTRTHLLVIEIGDEYVLVNVLDTILRKLDSEFLLVGSVFKPNK
jgi:hypothetical protein